MSNTTVYLLNVPLESDYKHTLFFNSRSEQEGYFITKQVKMGTNRSFQRKNGYIDWDEYIEELEGINYVMYRNGAKWVYAFITDKEYRNDSVTRLFIETDVIQSYMFDYTIKPSFVEREHCNDDTEGKHTIPENLEVGEYITKYNSNISEFQDTKIVVGVTTDEDGVVSLSAGTYNGAYSGIHYLQFDNIKDLISVMSEYKGRTDAIKVMFIAPSCLAEAPLNADELTNSWVKYGVLESTTPKINITQSFSRNVGKYDGENDSFKPKNNKLNCYPYRYLLLSNNNGASAIYQYEHFSEETITFECYGVLTPGCSIRAVPLNYKGVLENNEEGLNLGKYPICNWTSDEYTNWLTQNSINIGLNLASGIGQIVAGTAIAVGSGGLGVSVGGSQVVGGVSQIAGQLAQIHQMSFTPPQSHGNINCGDVVTSMNNNTFTFYGMAIKEEYARVIDEFFTMFGYKTNRVKVPLKNHRQNFWYTKTIDVSIDGAISNKDMQTIKNCYNNGITFWRSGEHIGDYSVTNEIV